MPAVDSRSVLKGEKKHLHRIFANTVKQLVSFRLLLMRRKMRLMGLFRGLACRSDSTGLTAEPSWCSRRSYSSKGLMT